VPSTPVFHDPQPTRSLMLAYRTALLLSVALATVASPPSALGAVAEVRQVPSVWQTGETSVVGYDVKVTAAAEDEELAIAYGLPEFNETRGERREPVGSALQDLRPRVVSGRRVSLALDPAPFAEYRQGTCFRGGQRKFGSVMFALPAHSITTIRLRFRLMAPPYRPADLAVPIELLTLREGSVLTRRTLRSGAPAFKGRSGVPVRVALSGGGPPFSVVKSGDVLGVRGRVPSRFAGRRLVLRHFASKSSFEGLFQPLPFTTLARPRIGRSGRFLYRWRPRRLGWHELRAVIPGSRLNLRDEGCPRRFVVTR